MAQRAEVVLGGEERETLERWARRPKSSQALAFRCRIVLAAAEGRASKEIAAELGCNHNTVGKWRGRARRGGFDWRWGASSAGATTPTSCEPRRAREIARTRGRPARGN